MNVDKRIQEKYVVQSDLSHPGHTIMRCTRCDKSDPYGRSFLFVSFNVSRETFVFDDGKELEK